MCLNIKAKVSWWVNLSMCDHTLELIFDLRDILRFESYVIGIVAREHHARFARNTTQW